MNSPNPKPLHAMVLAAGFGTRLRPLSDLLPKPLVPVANKPLISYSLALLKQAGVRHAAINLHHLGEKIKNAIGDGSGFGLTVRYSAEAEILGTGGGVVAMRPLMDDGTFVVVNADVLTSVPLSAAIQFHQDRRAAATMVVRPLPPGSNYTALGVDEQGMVVSLKDVRRPAQGKVRLCMFEGVHVLEPTLYDFLPKKGFSSIVDQAYMDMLRQGLPIAAYMDEGPWFDLGTLNLYLEANLALVSGRVRLPQIDSPGLRHLQDSVLLGRGVSIGKAACLGPEVIVGDECQVGAGARVAHSVLWPKARVDPGDNLDNVIIAGPHRVQL